MTDEEKKELKEEYNIKILSNAGIYQLGFNDGEKKVENKIKAKIEECREILYSFEKELELKANKDKFIYKENMNRLLGQISILQSLLEKE